MSRKSAILNVLTPIVLAGLAISSVNASESSASVVDPRIASAEKLYDAHNWDKAAAAAADILSSYSGAQAPDDIQMSAMRIELLSSFAKNDYSQTKSLLGQELDLSERAIRSQRGLLTGKGIDHLFEFLQVDEDIAYTLALGHPEDQEMSRLALRYTEARKGRRTREAFLLASETSAIAAQSSSPLAGKLREETKALTEVVQLEKSNVADVERIENSIDGIQKEILTTLHGIPNTMAVPDDIQYDAGVDRLVSSVSLGKALIVYVKFDRVAIGQEGHLVSAGSEYLGIVAHAGTPVATVGLGKAAKIDADARRFLAAVSTPTSDYASLGNTLYQELIEPLVPHIKYSDIDYGHQRVLISPDGELFLIPFQAIAIGQAYLIDQYDIVMVDTPLDALPTSSHTSLSPAASFLAFANPDLSWRTTQLIKARFGAMPESLKPLPDAKVEADKIASLWPASGAAVLSGRDANKDRFFRQAGTAGILHVATHGVIAPDPVSRAMLPREVVLRYSTTEMGPTTMSALARTAFLLGAETATRPAQDGVPPTGYVSAIEVAGMNLGSTQLVVLAACDSGTGDFERGEGVFGLRRAFLQAGAEAVVGSLWEVNSPATRDLMVAFYRSLMQGEDKGQALYAAERFVRRSHPEPYYWASFVLTGASSPLRLEATTSSGQ